MNKLSEYISKRKSIRKYKAESLTEDKLEEIREYIEELKPLYPEIKISCEIVDRIKSPVIVKAPHYLLFSSEAKDGDLENAGFMLQQMNLYFSSIGLGSCFLGMGKPAEKQQTKFPFIIMMAFGEPDEELYRSEAQFKRKSLANISEGEDPRIEAARLAPSAVNSQNWFFISEDDKIYVYRKKLNQVKAIFYDKTNCIDIGIALCNLDMVSDQFTFANSKVYPEKEGYLYMGTVE